MHIKLVNIRFRLDGDARDKKIHDALFQYPDGLRNQVMKDALYAHLIGKGAEKREQQPAPIAQARTPGRKAPATGKAKPEKQQQHAGIRNPPAQAEEPLATAGQPAEAEIEVSAANKGPVGSGEDEQVIMGLRSMIL